MLEGNLLVLFDMCKKKNNNLAHDLIKHNVLKENKFLALCSMLNDKELANYEKIIGM